MKRSLMVSLAVLFLATMGFAGPVSLSFNSNPGGGTYYDSSLGLVIGDLTITAKSYLGSSDDPLNPEDATPSSVFWGDLGNLDTLTCNDLWGGPCNGLGVQLWERDRWVGGKGIDGEGDGANEALIFTFSDLVQADSVHLTLVGLNQLGNTDDVNLQFKFAGVGGLTTIVDYYFGYPWGADVTIDFSTLAGIPSDYNFGAFSVEATAGRFGVRGIDYTASGVTPAVPEPGTLLLLGTGLIAAGRLARRRKRA